MPDGDIDMLEHIPVTVGMKFARTIATRRNVYHVRAIVDDEYVVYRCWSPRRGWMYNVEHIYGIRLTLRDQEVKP